MGKLKILKNTKSLIILIFRNLCYIVLFERFPHYNTGQISELSSTTLSNDVLAVMLVKNQLHHFFRHNLPEKKFKDFVEEQQKNGHLFPHETVSRK
jgi:hypothetical protein